MLDIFFEALNYEAIEQKKAYDLAGLLGDSPAFPQDPQLPVPSPAHLCSPRPAAPNPVTTLFPSVLWPCHLSVPLRPLALALPSLPSPGRQCSSSR